MKIKWTSLIIIALILSGIIMCSLVPSYAQLTTKIFYTITKTHADYIVSIPELLIIQDTSHGKHYIENGNIGKVTLKGYTTKSISVDTRLNSNMILLNKNKKINSVDKKIKAKVLFSKLVLNSHTSSKGEAKKIVIVKLSNEKCHLKGVWGSVIKFKVD